MNTNKVAYWIVLGALALGLSSEYRNGNFVALHRVAERADSALCRISTRAKQTLTAVLGITSRHEFRADDLLAANDRAEMARAETEMVREQARARAEVARERVQDEISVQADVIRERAEMQRAQIEQIGWRRAPQVRLARTDNRRVMVACPKTGTRIRVNPGAELGDISSDVEVGDTF